MEKTNFVKRIVIAALSLAVALLLALSIGVGMIFGSESDLFGMNKKPLNAEDAESKRVTILDLMERYPADFVLGPIDVVDRNGDGEIDRNDLFYRNAEDQLVSNGKFQYYQDDAHAVRNADGTFVYDSDGNKIYTNNIYGIPAEQYFDVENYIYTDANTTYGGRTLFGWKPDIRSVDPSYDADKNVINTKIAENGEIISGSLNPDVASPTGIYCQFASVSQDFGTSVRYALIVPKNITMVGQGSAAFVATVNGTLTAIYNSQTNISTGGQEVKRTGNGIPKYTDFGCFITNRLGRDSEPYFWQPRERLAGVFFPEGSQLKEIASGTYLASVAEVSNPSPGANRTMELDIGKSAFQGCDNMRFMILPDGVTKIGHYAFFKCTQVVDTNIPKTVTSVGVAAYYQFGQLVHISIPSSLTTLPQYNDNTNTDNRKPFIGCDKLLHVEREEGAASLNNLGLPTTNNDLYVFGGAPENGVLDNGRRGFLFTRTGSGTSERWSAVGFSGETGEAPNSLFIFPDSGDFNENSDRRKGIRYDYLDCDANKYKNPFTAGANVTYDIADNFANGTWCRRAITPASCTAIGTSAFNGSHVEYFETYATTIGASAFAGNSDSTLVQWLYFHEKKGADGSYSSTDYFTIAANAFGTVGTRHVVFEDNALYKKYETNHRNIPWPTGNVHYQIPIIAHVDNEDPDYSVSIKGGYSDMATRFFNDTDYVENPEFTATDKQFTYTKRLTGYTYNNVKQWDGKWEVGDESNKHTSPLLSNMSSTVWYGSDAYTAEKKASYEGTITLGSSTTKIDLYTKNIARPKNIFNKTFDSNGTYDSTEDGAHFTYDKEYSFSGNVTKKIGDGATEYIDYMTVLGLGNDYAVSLASFLFPDNQTPSKPTYVKNAGSYKFNIMLASKWGEWSEEFLDKYPEYFAADVVVDRAKINLMSLDDVPAFAYGDDDSNLLLGEKTTLYGYNEGWYLSQKGDSYEEPDIKEVTNAYAFYNGENKENPNITIKLVGEKPSADGGTSTITNPHYDILSRNGLSFVNSGSYTATFVVQVPYTTGVVNQTNYIFYYGDNEDTNYNDMSDSVRGLTVAGKGDYSFRITKRWYIVMQTNMFVEEGHEDSDTSYSPLANATFTYTDGISVATPVLKYGNDVGTITFDLSYAPVDGKNAEIITQGENVYVLGDDGKPSKANDKLVSRLPYYINSSMPAGTYTLVLHGSAVSVKEDGTDKSYGAVGATYTINVLPKPFDGGTLKSIHETLRGALVTPEPDSQKEIDKWVNAYPLVVEGTNEYAEKLHDSIDAQKAALESVRNGDINASTGYWATDKAKSDYYASEVLFTYNLEGSGSALYVNYETMRKSLVSTSTYTVYYCIEAKNYVTVGGASESDRTLHGFRTTVYTEMKLLDIYEYIVETEHPQYFQNVTYTGSPVYTEVPYSRYYRSSFDDALGESTPKKDYINVRKGASVTLTLNDPVLARWSIKGLPTDGIVSDGIPTEQEIKAFYEKYFKISDDGTKLFVYFDIVPAVNDWTVAPSISSWAYDGFNINVNVIRYGLKFTGADIYFRIGTKDEENGTYTWVKISETPQAGIDDTSYGAYFTIKDNKIVDDGNNTIAKVLKALPAGTYYLGSYIAPRADGNVSEFLTPDARYSTFNVISISNRWTTTPALTGGPYKGYTAENFRAGIPAYGKQENVKYTIYSGDNVDPSAADSSAKIVFGPFTQSTMPSGDEINNKLGAGRYTFYALLEGTGDYGDLDYSMTVVVSKATNTWTTTPGMTGWDFGSFTAANFRAGAANFDEDKNNKKITYTLYVGENVNPDTEAGKSAEKAVGPFFAEDMSGEELVNKLKQLAPKSYTFYVKLEGTDNYEDLVYTTTVVVSQASNGWVTKPNMLGWIYDGFDVSNFTAGVPIFGGEKAVKYVVRNQNIEFGGDVTIQSVAAELNKLSVGSYTIDISIAAGTGYPAFTDTVTFTVSSKSNSWTTTPGLTGWAYRGFNTALFRTGVAEYVAAGKQIKYELYDGAKGEGKSPIAEWTSAADLAGETLFNKLNNLPPKSYTLYAFLEGDKNYADLSYETTVVVSKADNAWKTTPRMVGWVYGSFTESGFTAGVPVLGAESEVVYKVRGTEITFTSGSITEELKAKLNGLGVGDYTIDITLNGDGVNYNDFKYEISFKVSKASNSWTTTPRITGWTYGNYASTDFIAGVPVFGGVNGVKYEVYKTEDESKNVVLTFYANTVDLANKLNGLGVGNYTVGISVAGDDNYNEFTYDISFGITKSANSWTTMPVLTGWAYRGFTTNLFRAGVSKHPGGGDVVYKLYSVEGDDNHAGQLLKTFKASDIGTTELKQYLTALKVASYILTAELEGTDNYEELTYETTVVVSKADNRWTTTPGMTGWVYSNFAVGNFTAGVAAFDEDPSKKITYTLTSGGVAHGSPFTSDQVSSLVSFFNGLKFGTYTLTVTLEGTDNYEDLEYPITFNVSQRANSWTNSPRLSSFKYSQFEASSNFAAGVPSYPLDNKQVDYGIFTARIDSSQAFLEAKESGSGVTFNNITDTVSVGSVQMTVTAYLNSLDCDTYYFVAYVRGTTDYAELYSCTEFVISTASNAWKSNKNTQISGWVYGSFNASLFTGGEANFGVVKYTVQTVGAGGNIDTDVTGYIGLTAEELLNKLNNLDAGSYNLLARAADDENNNFEAVTQNVRFAVEKAENSWKGNPPSIEGWVYDGKTTGKLTTSTATVDTGEITYKYYPAQFVNGAWTQDGEEVTDLTKAHPGNYIMIATAPENTNYKALSITVPFTVSRHANDWDNGNEPEDRLEWTWGKDSLETSKLYNAAALDMSNGLTYTIVVSGTNAPVGDPISVSVTGGVKNASDLQNLLKALKALAASDTEYKITVAVAETADYTSLTKSTLIKVDFAEFEVVTEPDGRVEWVWGPSTSKDFKDIEVKTVLDSDKEKIEFTYSITGIDSYKKFGDMLAKLREQNAGDYQVTIKVECVNYVTVQRLVTVHIAKADFVWDDGKTPADVEWVWDDDASVKSGKLIRPAAHDLSNNAVTLVYHLSTDGGASSSPYTEFGELVKYLTSEEPRVNAGRYVITVSAAAGSGYDLINYNEFETVYTVTVKQADNELYNKLGDRYSAQYSEKDNIVNAIQNATPPSAKHGDVVFYDESGEDALKHNGVPVTSVAELIEWIKSLGANDNGAYVFYTVVAETDNYKGLKVKTELIITGTKSLWKNQDKLGDATSKTVEFNYVNNADDMGASFDGLDIPVGKDDGVTKYTLTYRNSYLEEEVTRSGEKGTRDEVVSWLKSRLTADDGQYVAGAYTIVADYVPGDKSYSSLSYTLVVNVLRAKPQWNETLEERYTGTFGSIVDDNLNISVKDYDAPIDIRVSDTDGGTYDYDSLNGTVKFGKFINSLNAIATNYIVTYKVLETANYEGLTEKQCYLYISSIQNEWIDSYVGDTLVDWDDGYTWTYLRKQTISVVIPKAKAGNDKLIITLDGAACSDADALNDRLINLSAGEHTLNFTIDSATNYSGVSSSCRIIINLIPTEWSENARTGKKGLEDYIGNGSVNISVFPIPTSDVRYVNIGGGSPFDLLRFDIYQAGTDYGKYTIDVEDLKKELALIRNGTFTVNAYIGGGYYRNVTPSSLLDTALGLYNADYVELFSTCTITLSQYKNEWTASFAPGSVNWEWGSFASSLLTMPEALYGENTIVYSLTQNGDEKAKFEAGRYNEHDGKSPNEQAFDELIAYLTKTIGAGNYTLTVTIAATGDYTAPEPMIRFLQVSKQTATWNAATALTDGLQYVWYFNERENPPTEKTPKKPVVNDDKNYGDWGKGIQYTLADSGARPTPYDSWEEMITALKKQNPGDYTLRAFISGDDNHQELTYSVIVKIEKSVNEWVSKLGNGTSTPPADDDTDINRSFGDDLSDIFGKFKPLYGTVEFTVDGRKVDDLNEHVRVYGAKTYVLTAIVNEDDTYTSLVDSVRLVISKAKNSWQEDSALSVGKKFGELSEFNKWEQTEKDIWANRFGWVWDNVVSNIDTVISLPIPTQGDSATLSVTYRDSNGREQLAMQMTIDYELNKQSSVKEVSANSLDVLESKLKARNALEGAYTITVSVGSTENYDALADKTFDFYVKKAKNGWSLAPYVDGWKFGSSTARPASQARFGANTVEYTFADITAGDEDKEVGNTEGPAGSVVWATTHGAEAGKYWLKAEVPDDKDGNYGGIVGYYLFEIGAGVNEWVTMPGVIGWKWSGYDPAVNLFQGSARSKGEVTFAIMKGNSLEQPLTLGDFDADGAENVIIKAEDIAALNAIKLVDGVVTDEKVIKLLKYLKPNSNNGVYHLYAKAEGGASLGGVDGWATFQISKAENGWKTASDGTPILPSVTSFSYGMHEGAFTAGEVLFGNIKYAISGNNVNYTNLDEEGVKAKLGELNASERSYTLSAQVAESVKGLYAAVSIYTTTFTVNFAANEWVKDHSPKDTANVYYTVLKGYEVDGDEDKWIELIGDIKAQADGSVVYFTIFNADTNGQIGNARLEFTEFKAELKKLTPATYSVRIFAEAPNYAVLNAEKNLSLTILKYNAAFTELPQNNVVGGKWQKNKDGELNTTVDAITLKPVTYITEVGDGAEIDNFELSYTLSGDNITSVTVNGIKSLSKLNAELAVSVKNLASGPYTIAITLKETLDYYGATVTLQIIIAPGDNSWDDGDDTHPAPAPENTLVEKGTSSVTHNWKWGSDIEWLGVKPRYGNTVIVMIVEAGSEAVVKYITIDTSTTSSFDKGKKEVSDCLSNELNVGSYIMIITTPADDNWNGIVDQATSKEELMAMLGDEQATITTRVPFTIETADNGWEKDGKPCFVGDDVTYTEDTKTYTWTFGKTVAAEAKALYGTVEFLYYEKLDNGSWSAISGMPVNVGTYKAEFVVADPATHNYKPILADEESAKIYKNVFYITIEGALLDSFKIQPGVGDWSWNNYLITNKFVGEARSGGTITYSVYAADTLKIAGFTLDSNGYVDAEIKNKLNALTSGEYTLKVHVAANGNYAAFDAQTTFNVTEDANAWVVEPNIASWFSGGFNPDENMPEGRATYGVTTIVITSQSSGAEWFRSAYDANSGATTVTTNNLEAAEIGWYTMVVSVEAAPGMYKGTSSTRKFQVFPKGSLEVKNYWVESPNIEDWTANIEGTFKMPTGTPARGKVYFKFYPAEFVNDQYQKTGDALGEGDDVTTVSDGKYARPFYIPKAPGIYMMYAHVENVAAADHGDDLEWGYTILTIYDRVNKWAQSVTIAPVLYLGEKNSWAKPTASTTLESKITYKYYEADTREELDGTEIPTKPGKYVVVATAEATYCQNLTSEMEFEVRLSEIKWAQSVAISDILRLGDKNKPGWGVPTASVNYPNITIVYEFYDAETDMPLGNEAPKKVGSYYVIARASAPDSIEITSRAEFIVELSKNNWVNDTSPTIEDWSEEHSDTAPDPKGEAAVGKVEYTYIDKNNPDKEFKEKPTTAGDYILVARVVVDGYETLEARYEFTIGPAFDRTLLTIDIILAAVASIFAIVVIYFA
ncbi:MAG: leucine-rich repeat domain-containing protein, partial [Clostridiales bacterium]|nr:leucine-rich repeat domain-containing protein [Clostridiales bacterium]